MDEDLDGLSREQLVDEVKRLRAALETSGEDAKKLLPATVSLVDIMVKKGVIHENTGNRYKSRLARRIASS